MSASKEYFLKLSEDFYNSLHNEEQKYLNHLGMEVRQLATDEDLKDANVKTYKKEIAKTYKKLNDYLFDKRNK
jgi:TRAP-type C4-dicarboxylate transport system substrate-binding protein